MITKYFININDYQKEKENYQKMKTDCQKEICAYLKKSEKKEAEIDIWDEYLESMTEIENQVIPQKKEDPSILRSSENKEITIDQSIEKKLEKLEKLTAIKFAEEEKIEPELDLFEQEQFLYHGLRFSIPEGLKKLRGILEQKNILAGKYLDDYYPYRDNCNEGEYISLIPYNDSLEFKTFVRPYICLIISPFCEAYKTTHVSFDIWDYIKEQNLSLKNRYSYVYHEYHVKDHIPIDMVMAVGIPYFDIVLHQGRENAQILTESIRHLLECYEMPIPIVDINCYNQAIDLPEKQNVFQKKYHK